MKHLIIPLIALFVLACGVSAPLLPPATAAPVPAKTAGNDNHPLVLLRSSLESAPKTTIATVTAYALHIRVNHSYMAERVGYLKRGDIVIVTGVCVGGWLPVEFEDVTGWVNARYLDDEGCK